MADEVEAATGKRLTPQAIAEGFLAIAVDNMANAIKQVSVARGYDVTRYVLACFGGAGGQHACLVADALGMTRIMIHPLAGRIVGLRHGAGGYAAMLKQRTLEAPLADDACFARADALLTELDRAGEAELKRAGRIAAERIRGRTSPAPEIPRLRHGAGGPLRQPLDEMRAAFDAAYRRRFAFTMPETPLVAESLSGGADRRLGRRGRRGRRRPLRTRRRAGSHIRTPTWPARCARRRSTTGRAGAGADHRWARRSSSTRPQPR